MQVRVLPPQPTDSPVDDAAADPALLIALVGVGRSAAAETYPILEGMLCTGEIGEIGETGESSVPTGAFEVTFRFLDLLDP